MSKLVQRDRVGTLEGPAGPSTFDVITRAVLPVALAILAVQAEGARFWGLLGVMLLVVGLGFGRMGLRQGQAWLSKWRDRRAARALFPQVERLVHGFGQLVDPNKNTTLESVLQTHVCRGGSPSLHELGLTRIQLIHDLWLELDTRVLERSPSDPSLLVTTLGELTTLVTNYLRHCVDPLFDGLPEPMKNSIPGTARPYLEEARQRVASYVDRLEWCWREVGGSLQTVAVRDRYLWRPRPL